MQQKRKKAQFILRKIPCWKKKICKEIPLQKYIFANNTFCKRESCGAREKRAAKKDGGAQRAPQEKGERGAKVRKMRKKCTRKAQKCAKTCGHARKTLKYAFSFCTKSFKKSFFRKKISLGREDHLSEQIPFCKKDFFRKGTRKEVAKEFFPRGKK